MDISDMIQKYDQLNAKKMIEKFENFLNFHS